MQVNPLRLIVIALITYVIGCIIGIMTACGPPARLPEDERAISAVWSEMHAERCQRPVVKRVDQSTADRWCGPGAASCAPLAYPLIALAPGYHQLDARGEPVVHEAIHVAQWCLNGRVDYGHTGPEWTASGGESSVQSRARRSYARPAP